MSWVKPVFLSWEGHMQDKTVLVRFAAHLGHGFKGNGAVVFLLTRSDHAW
jgi:hypothetical protein